MDALRGGQVTASSQMTDNTVWSVFHTISWTLYQPSWL